MPTIRFSPPQILATGLVGLSCGLLAACGADSSSSSARSHAAELLGADNKSVQGPLDPAQAALFDDTLSGSLASSLPEPLGPTVACLTDGLNAMTDAPDALLNAIDVVATGADPVSAMQGAQDEITASLQEFAGRTQSTLLILAGQQDECSGGAEGGNPLAGTPLAPVGDALMTLVDTLNQPGSKDDPDLRPLAAALGPVLADLAAAFDQVPPEVREAPVLGGLITTLQIAVGDLAATMPAIGAYDPVGTQAGTEALLNHLLSNVLLGVLPVGEIDDATGEDFSGQIQGSIDQATAALGDGLGQLITPAFDDALNGALEPVLDPVEGLIAQILNQDSPLTGSNPLNGLLADVPGDGSGTPLDTLLAMFSAGASGNSLGELTTLLGGTGAGSPLDQLGELLAGAGLPADTVLGLLQQDLGSLPALGDLLDRLGN